MSTTQRDALAAVIVSAYGEDADELCPCEQDFQVAEAILAAGYRKPVSITTVEELRALKEGTRLLGRDYKPGCGRLWRVEKFGVVDIERPLDGICGFNYFKDPLPAIVLTEPEAEVGA